MVARTGRAAQRQGNIVAVDKNRVFFGQNDGLREATCSSGANHYSAVCRDCTGGPERPQLFSNSSHSAATSQYGSVVFSIVCSCADIIRRRWMSVCSTRRHECGPDAQPSIDRGSRNGRLRLSPLDSSQTLARRATDPRRAPARSRHDSRMRECAERLPLLPSQSCYRFSMGRLPDNRTPDRSPSFALLVTESSQKQSSTTAA